MRTDSEQSGGNAPEPPRPAPGGVGAWVVGVVLGLVVIGLILAAWTLGKNQGDGDDAGAAPTSEQTTSAPVSAPPPLAAGDHAAQELFTANCAGCHTLAAAQATGTGGPDLDALAPDGARVLAAIENGGTGVGVMPANLLEGVQAQRVADYVATVTGGG